MTADERSRRLVPALVLTLFPIAALFLGGRLGEQPLPPRALADWTATARTVSDTGTPFWNARVGIGEPLLAQPEAGALFPLRAALAVAPPPIAIRIVGAIVVAIGAVGLLAFLRALSLSWGAAAFGAVVLGVAGPFIQARHEPFAAAIAALPWALWLVERGVGPRTDRLAEQHAVAKGEGRTAGDAALRIAALALVLAFAASAGHLPAAIAVFAAALAWSALRGGAPQRSLRSVLGTGLAATLGAGLAAPWLFPAITELRAGTTALLPASPATALAALGSAIPACPSSLSFGGVALVIVIIGVPFGLIVGTALRGATLRLAVMFGAAVAIGFAVDARAGALIALFGAALSAVGLDAILRGRGEGGPPPLTAALAIGTIAAVVTGGAALVAGVVEADTAVTFGAFLSHPVLRTQLPLFAAHLTALLVAAVTLGFFLRGPLPGRVCLGGLVALVAIEAVVASHLSRTTPSSTPGATPSATNALAEATGSDGAPMRSTVITSPTAAGGRERASTRSLRDVRFVDGRTPPRVAAVLDRLRTPPRRVIPRWLDRIDTRRVVSSKRLGVPLGGAWVEPGEHAVYRLDLTGAWGGNTAALEATLDATPSLRTGDTVARVTVRALDDRVVTARIECGRERTSIPLAALPGPLAALEIEYLGERGRLRLHRFSPGSEVAATPWGKRAPLVLATDGRPFVYRNTAVAGRARVCAKAVHIPDSRERIEAVAEAKPENRDTVVLTRAVDSTASHVARDPDRGAGKVGVRRYGDGKIDLEVAAATAGWIVISESWSPGWRAELDGRPIGVVCADHALLGVFVARGAAPRRVELRYSPPRFTAGLWSAAAALVALCFLVFRPRPDGST